MRGLNCAKAVALCLALAASAGDADAADGDKPAKPRALRVGDKAPLLTLKTLDGKASVDLAGFGGKKPVVLFFGSYT